MKDNKLLANTTTGAKMTAVNKGGSPTHPEKEIKDTCNLNPEKNR